MRVMFCTAREWASQVRRHAGGALALILGCATLTLPAQAVETTRVLSLDSVIAKHADADAKFIEVDGVKVHYKDAGHGPAVLLVHGTMGDLDDWDGWLPTLARDHRVLRFDMPGFAMTGPLPSGNYSVDRMMSFIDAFMDLMGEEHFAIAGTSYGGLVSFRYAATRTDRVTALILTNSAGIEYGKGPKQPQAASGASTPAPQLHNVLTDPVIDAKDVEANLSNVLVNKQLITPEMIQRKLDFQNVKGRAEEGMAGRKLYERGDPLRVLAHVRAPAIVIWGAGSQVLSTQTADAFVAAMKNSCHVEREMVPNAGHLSIVDQPEKTSQMAESFLARLPSFKGCRSPAER
jgi:pimeloyl-ACP methyl ester carboxylesterase